MPVLAGAKAHAEDDTLIPPAPNPVPALMRAVRLGHQRRSGISNHWQNGSEGAESLAREHESVLNLEIRP